MKAEGKTKTLLSCGAIAGPLFVLVFLVEGATRAGYDPLRHPVSSLALGDHGWTQIAEVLGVSKQAVHKKHAKRIRAKYPGEPPPRRKGRGA